VLLYKLGHCRFAVFVLFHAVLGCFHSVFASIFLCRAVFNAVLYLFSPVFYIFLFSSLLVRKDFAFNVTGHSHNVAKKQGEQTKSIYILLQNVCPNKFKV